MSQLIAYYWKRSVPILSKWPGFKEQFTFNGRAPEEGEIWRNEALANTLELLVSGGRDFFYEGEIARNIDRYMKENDGFLSYDDLRSHREIGLSLSRQIIVVTMYGNCLPMVRNCGLQILNLMEL
ncbi:MAG: hypothetical protein CM15mP51_20280 [Porticoccaceae bacterium]|nr:MAG: hypothetical protein CM15mP51_20280 [Porticoccaceae bacterium]